MKRFIVLVILLLAMAAGCAAGGKDVALPDRALLLPDTVVSGLAGVPMALVYDRLDRKAGFAFWAWQETEGLPRLLAIELRFPPADCDGLYEAAQAGAELLVAPDGAAACYDGRAAHVRIGAFYGRISALGLQEEKDALQQVIDGLVPALAALDKG